MPTFTIKNPETGKTIEITRNTVPTDAEIDELFAKESASPVAKVRKFLGFTPPNLTDTYNMPTRENPGVLRFGLADLATNTGRAYDKYKGIASGAADFLLGRLPATSGAGDVLTRAITPDSIEKRVMPSKPSANEQMVRGAWNSPGVKGMLNNPLDTAWNMSRAFAGSPMITHPLSTLATEAVEDPLTTAAPLIGKGLRMAAPGAGRVLGGLMEGAPRNWEQATDRSVGYLTRVLKKNALNPLKNPGFKEDIKGSLTRIMQDWKAGRIKLEKDGEEFFDKLPGQLGRGQAADDFFSSVTQSLKNVWDDIHSYISGSDARGAKVTTTQIADALEKAGFDLTTEKGLKYGNPELYKALTERVQLLRNADDTLNLNELQSWVKELNGKLPAKPSADFETAKGLRLAADEARAINGIFDEIVNGFSDENNAISTLKKQYAQLKSVQRHVSDLVSKAAKQEYDQQVLDIIDIWSANKMVAAFAGRNPSGLPQAMLTKLLSGRMKREKNVNTIIKKLFGELELNKYHLPEGTPRFSAK